MVAPSRLALVVATISAILGIGMVTAGFYYSIQMFSTATPAGDLEGGLTGLVSIIMRLVPLAVGMTAGGYLLDRGLWSLLKLRDREEEAIESAYSP